jgi:CRP-like cAMP-binding protein
MRMMEPDVAQKVNIFFSQFPSRIYRRDDILIYPKDEKKLIYYLEQGHVRQHVITKSGEDVTMNIYKPGAFFPMAHIVDTFHNTHTFEAIDNVFVKIAEYKAVVIFLKKEPDVLFDLLQRVYTGLEGVLSHMEQLMSGSARKRLLIALFILAKRFGKSMQDNNVHISLKLTHQDLAASTGLTRETVSREMALLKQQEFIDYANVSITIKNIQNIEKELH